MLVLQEAEQRIANKIADMTGGLSGRCGFNVRIPVKQKEQSSTQRSEIRRRHNQSAIGDKNTVNLGQKVLNIEYVLNDLAGKNHIEDTLWKANTLLQVSDTSIDTLLFGMRDGHTGSIDATHVIAVAHEHLTNGAVKTADIQHTAIAADQRHEFLYAHLIARVSGTHAVALGVEFQGVNHDSLFSIA